MISKSNTDKYIFTSLIIIFSVATILVVCYVAFSSLVCANIALSIYSLSFILMCLFSMRKLFIINNYKKRMITFNEENFDDEDIEYSEYITQKPYIEQILKKTYSKELTKSILSGIFGIFTLVVLILL